MERGVDLASVQSFETELLAQAENLAGLAALNRGLVAEREPIDLRRRVALDMDSTEARVSGCRSSAYNGARRRIQPGPRPLQYQDDERERVYARQDSPLWFVRSGPHFGTLM